MNAGVLDGLITVFHTERSADSLANLQNDLPVLCEEDKAALEARGPRPPRAGPGRRSSTLDPLQCHRGARRAPLTISSIHQATAAQPALCLLCLLLLVRGSLLGRLRKAAPEVQRAPAPRLEHASPADGHAGRRAVLAQRPRRAAPGAARRRPSCRRSDARRGRPR